MTWYYVDAGQQAGPVDDAQLEELSRTGKIQSETLVWREGMANWEPYSKVKPSAPAALAEPPMPSVPPVAPAAGDVPKEGICSECGKTFATADMIQHHGRYICAGCKPIFFQRLREGASLAPSGAAGSATEEQLLAREYDVDIGDAMSRSWEVFTQNAGLAIGVVLLSALIFLVGGVIGLVAGIIVPVSNYFIGALYTVPTMAGVLWLFLRLIRGEPATVGDMFAGFRSNYGSLLVFNIIQVVINLVCLLPMFFMGIGLGVSSRIGRTGSPPNFSPEMAVALGAAFFLGICAMVYVNVLLIYTPLLIVDKGYGFWPAMQLSRKMASRRWWMTFLFVFVSGIISSLGVIACIVGLLVTVPLYFGMTAALYDRNFRDLRHQ
jgi:uncharacterized membrane protein